MKVRLAPQPMAEMAEVLREESRWLVRRAMRLPCAPALPSIYVVTGGPQFFGKCRLGVCDSAG